MSRRFECEIGGVLQGAVPWGDGPASARRTWGLIRTFRRVREELRVLGAADAPLDRLQFQLVADRLEVGAGEVEAAVSEWIFQRPLGCSAKGR